MNEFDRDKENEIQDIQNVINEEFDKIDKTFSAEKEEAEHSSYVTDEKNAKKYKEEEYVTPFAVKEEVIESGELKENMPFYRETIKHEAQKQKTGKFRRTVAIVAIASVLGGGSLGVGIGIGIPVAENYFVPKAVSEEVPETIKYTESEVVLPASTFSQSTPQAISYASVIKKVEPSVVSIVSTVSQYSGMFNFNMPETGAGSGILFDAKDGKYYIVTNYHVVQNAESVMISIQGCEPVPAEMIGKDATNDIAVISVSMADVKKAGVNSVTLATFGDSDAMEVGDVVLAIGNALGEGNTATEGIVSAKNKSVVIEQVNYTAIQTSAAINPGNSGGPLINLTGEVIGINSAKLSSTSSTDSTVENMGYSIPSNVVKEKITELTGPKKPMIGIQGGDISAELSQQYNLPQAGAIIDFILEGSPAEKAGLQLNDIITGFNGHSILKFTDLQAAVQECSIGDSVEVKIIRNGKEFLTLTLELEAFSDDSF